MALNSFKGGLHRGEVSSMKAEKKTVGGQGMILWSKLGGKQMSLEFMSNTYIVLRTHHAHKAYIDLVPFTRSFEYPDSEIREMSERIEDLINCS